MKEELNSELSKIKMPEMVFGSTSEGIYVAAKNFVERSPDYQYKTSRNRDERGLIKWNNCVWREIDRQYITNAVLDFVRDNPSLRHPRQVDSIVSAIKMQIPIVASADLYGAYRMDDGIIRINSPSNIIVVSPNGEITLEPHNRECMFTKCLDHDYIPEADERGNMYRQFLETVIPSAGDRILWRVAVSSVFEPNQRLEFALFLFGQGSNGKSTLLDSLQYALGKQNTSNTSLVDLSDIGGRNLIDLRYAMANLFMESGNIAVREMLMLKAIFSGEDMVSNAKWEKRERIRPSATNFFGTNHDIKITRPTYADTRRIRILVMNQTFRGSNLDSKMKDKLKTKDVGQMIIAYGINYMSELLKLNAVPFGGKDSQAVYSNFAMKADAIHYFLTNLIRTFPSREIDKDSMRLLLTNFVQERKINLDVDRLEADMWRRLREYDITETRPRSKDDPRRPRILVLPEVKE